jgi:hypothetical protein
VSVAPSDPTFRDAYDLASCTIFLMDAWSRGVMSCSHAWGEVFGLVRLERGGRRRCLGSCIGACEMRHSLRGQQKSNSFLNHWFNSRNI